MTVAAIQPPVAARTAQIRAATAVRPDAARCFEAALASANADWRKTDVDRLSATVRTAAQQLVASTLVLPVLNQMQTDPFRTDLFHGGSAEEIFAAQLNVALADRIVAKADFPIVHQIYHAVMQHVHRAAERETPADQALRTDAHG